MVGKYINTCKYSSIDKVKEIAKIVGWTGTKTEKDRKFLSDLKLLTTEYNDMAFNDLKEVVTDFKLGFLEAKLLIIDIREPSEIEKAKKEFNAFTVLIKNDNVKEITSNMADANVLNYTYDYVVNNSGTLDDLEMEVTKFITWLKED